MMTSPLPCRLGDDEDAKDEFHPVTDTKSVKKAAEMGPNGRVAAPQRRSDLLVAEALKDQRHDLCLLRR